MIVGPPYETCDKMSRYASHQGRRGGGAGKSFLTASRRGQDKRGRRRSAKNLDFGGSDSSRFVIVRGGTPMILGVHREDSEILTLRTLSLRIDCALALARQTDASKCRLPWSERT